jgi:hypothetical protein
MEFVTTLSQIITRTEFDVHLDENSEDRIVKISQPFLEYSIAD